MKKRILTAILALALLLSLVPTVFGAAHKVLQPGVPAEGTVTDISIPHFYDFRLEQDGYITLTMEHKYRNTDYYCLIEICNKNDELLCEWSCTGKTTREESPRFGLKAGSYEIHIQATQDPDNPPHSFEEFIVNVPYKITLSCTAASDWEKEYNNTPELANPLVPGQPVCGVIADKSDWDYYEIHLDQDRLVTLNLEHQTKAPEKKCWEIAFFTEEHHLFASFNLGEKNETSVVELGLNRGTYYVMLWGPAVDDVPAFNYQLTLGLSEPGSRETEPNNDMASADTLTPGVPVRGSFPGERGEPDYYVFRIDKMSLVSAVYEHETLDRDSKFWQVRILTEAGEELAYRQISAREERTELEEIVLGPGTYYVETWQYPFEDLPLLEYQLTVSCTEAGPWESEPNDDQSTADVLPLNTKIQGTLNAQGTDRDCYTFELEKPGHIAVNFEHDPLQSDNSHLIWEVRLSTRDGKEILTDDPCRGQEPYKSPEIGLPAGKYDITVSCPEGGRPNPARYRLQVTWTEADDWETELNDSLETADELKSGGKISGTITNYADDDFYVFRMEKDGYAELTFRCTNGADWDNAWYVDLLDEEGNQLKQIGIPKDSEMKTGRTGLAAGTYYVKVWPGLMDVSPYTLELVTAAADSWEKESGNDTEEGAQALELNETGHGTIMFNEEDRDFWKLTLSEAQKVFFYFRHEKTGAEDSRWEVILYNEEMWQIDSWDVLRDDTRDLLGARELEPGTYYLLIRGWRTCSGAYTVAFADQMAFPGESAVLKFTDVHYEDWFRDAINFSLARGLFGGTSDHTFEPDTPMTRAMLVTVLWRYEGMQNAQGNPFDDVSADEWYYTAVLWAHEKNIVNGVGDRIFAPDDPITREQMATMLSRYAEWKGLNTAGYGDLSIFPDGKMVSSWAEAPMKWAVGGELIAGSEGMLLPQGNATRAQVATILMRFIQNLAE